jgi:hypothetical protein
MNETQETKSVMTIRLSRAKRMEDPGSGLMDMMRNLDEEGDDHMINLLWRTYQKSGD